MVSRRRRVEALAVQSDASVVIDPPDADEDADGDQVAVEGGAEITVTVTLGRRHQREDLPRELPRGGVGPGQRSLAALPARGGRQGFSLVVFKGGSVEELVACAESRDIVALYTLHEGICISYILGAPDFVNRQFRELFPDGLAAMTPLVTASNGLPSADRCGDDLAGDGRQPWPQCLRGGVATGFSLVVYEGGSIDELAACAQGRGVTAAYALAVLTQPGTSGT